MKPNRRLIDAFSEKAIDLTGDSRASQEFTKQNEMYADRGKNAAPTV